MKFSIGVGVECFKVGSSLTKILNFGSAFPFDLIQQ